MRRWIVGGIAVMAFVCVGTVAAYADIVPNSAPTITPNGPNFTWAYTLEVNNAENVCPSCNASFFTLYDVPGLLPGSSTWVPFFLSGTTSELGTGLTPIDLAVNDNPAIDNVSVQFTNSFAPTGTVLGKLSFVDSSGTQSEVPTMQFAAQGTEASDGAISVNSSFVRAPAPEPGTLALLASGLVGMIGAAVRRRRA